MDLTLLLYLGSSRAHMDDGAVVLGQTSMLSKALGSRTVLSGSVSRGKNHPSHSLQMVERALLPLTS